MTDPVMLAIGVVFVVGLVALKLHIMRVCVSHPEHRRVCRNQNCVCRELQR